MAKTDTKAPLQKQSKHRRIPRLVIIGVTIVVLLGVLAVFLWPKAANDSGASHSDAQPTSSTTNTGTPSSTSQTPATQQQNTAAPSTGTNKSSGSSTDKSSGTSGNTTPSTGTSAPSGTSQTPPAPTPPPLSVTGVALHANSTNASAGCGQTFTFVFTGTISASAAGSLTYQWTQTDIGTTGPFTLNFGAAGSQTVTKEWTFKGTDTQSFIGNVTLRTIAPNSMSSTLPFQFTSTCL